MSYIGGKAMFGRFPLFWFLMGVIVGAAAALMLAPARGVELREQLAGTATAELNKAMDEVRKLREQVEDATDELEDASDALEDASEQLEDATDQLEEAS
jgi:gas vesicle protein